MFAWSLKFSYDKEIRRKEIQQPYPLTYRVVLDSVYSVFPNLHAKTLLVSWIDDEGDKIVCSSDQELQDAMAIMTQRGAKVFHFFVKIDRSLRLLFSAFKQDRCFNRVVHVGVSCSNCGITPIQGARYQCTFRSRFNLCEKCEERSVKNYPMIKIYDPVQASQVAMGSFSDRTSNDSPSIMSSVTFNVNDSYHVRPAHTVMEHTGPPESEFSNSEKIRGHDMLPSLPPSLMTTHPSLPAVSDGAMLPPRVSFCKTWKLFNHSELPWPEGSSLVPIGDNPFVTAEWRYPVPPLLPGCESEITVDFISPSLPGACSASFQVRSPPGKVLSEPLSLQVTIQAENENDWDVVDSHQKNTSPASPSSPAVMVQHPISNNSSDQSLDAH